MSELDFIEKAESHEEKIVCPNCGSIESATVVHTEPWWMYAHICSKCEYQILESEWNRFEELKEICFDNNYPKLHNQKQARLVLALQEIPGEMLRKNFFDLMMYDTERDDGLYYGIKEDEEYMLLLFVGEKNIMFSTLRKQNQENVELYAESIGELFSITVKSKGASNGRK